jgi:hypothetical protein
MKRLLLFSVSVLLVGPAAAQAQLIGSGYGEDYSPGAPITVSWVGTSYDSNLDKVVVSISSISSLAGGTSVSVMEGEWSAVGGGIFTYGDNADDPWDLYSYGIGRGPAAPQSFAHFTADVGKLSTGQDFSSLLGPMVNDYSAVYPNPTGGAGGATYQYFADAWFTLDPGYMPTAGGTPAQAEIFTLFVDKSVTQLSFCQPDIDGDLDPTWGICTYGPDPAFANAFVISAPTGNPGQVITSDPVVDINDLTIVLANYGKTGMAWSQGSIVGDPTGSVDINDLTQVLANYGNNYGASALGAVPEPAALLMLAAGLAGLLTYAWRRRQGA